VVYPDGWRPEEGGVPGTFAIGPRPAALAAARSAFGKDLGSGKLWNILLLGELPDILDFLEIPWPSAAVIRSIEDYVDQVLGAAAPQPSFTSFSFEEKDITPTDAFARFVLSLVGFPVVDVGVAARRVLSSFASSDPTGPTVLFEARQTCDSVQFEHLLASIQVASSTGVELPVALRGPIEQLNKAESAGVRGIAYRICKQQNWNWEEVTSDALPPAIVLPHLGQRDGLKAQEDAAVAAELADRILRALERSGNDPTELRSDLLQKFWDVKSVYRWRDDDRLQRWMKLVHARFWLSTRAIVGREAAMRLLGSRALSGRAPDGTDAAYDFIYPIYDPVLEMVQPDERPVCFRAMDWNFSDGGRERWLRGSDAESWSDYPETINDFCIVGERTYLIRPDWEWPREERLRGLYDGDGSGLEKTCLASGRELTHSMYLSEGSHVDEQLVIWNSDRQLVGPMHKWVAINSRFARSVGWRPSAATPFEWIDATGRSMVKSVFWRDGWVSLEPPRMEPLGEGWIVLASKSAIDVIKNRRPHCTVHLWVERHSHGEHPYQQFWHLHERLSERSGMVER